MRTATFIGTLGKEWDKKTVGDYTVWENSLAVKCGKNNKETMWVKLTQWGDKVGQTLEQYTGKGCKFAATGDVDCRAWVKDGDAKCQIELRVNSFDIVEFKKTDEPKEEEIPF